MSTAVLAWGAAIALAVALAGAVYRAAGWFTRRVGTAAPAGRLAAAASGAFGALFSRRLPKLAWAFAFDVLLQGRLLRRDPVRWAAHLAIFVGFTGLLLTHALKRVVTKELFDGYVATLNPWLALRDAFGLAFVAGLAVGFVRRRSRRGSLPAPKRRDPLFVALLLTIVLSGFALLASKTVSSRSFDRMTAKYAAATDEELPALRAYWAAELGVVFADGNLLAREPGAEELGRALHEQGCADCHARPQTAAVSWPLARALRPVAGPLTAANAEGGLLWLHVLASLAALAYLPFGRFFHAVADPVSLLAAAGAATVGAPANAATRRALALDACVRCGLCDERCSVKPLARVLDNPWVLPAAKILSTREVASSSALEAGRLRRIAEGAFACSECGRCAAGCPAGLGLDDLWAANREQLASRGAPAAAVWVKQRTASDWAEQLASAPAEPAAAPAIARSTSLALERRTYSPCVQCQTCTNVCPVVAHSAGEGAVDATPQKVMNLLRLGLVDLALGSRMVWDCATCYQCQENCPSEIRVTEVLYELRNRAYERFGPLAGPGGGAP